jgi:tRNA G26 N,N-dimethylase Trm1
VSLDEIEERGTMLYAERQDEPDTGAEVFYNPEMRTNRDLSIAAAETYFGGGASVLDATAVPSSMRPRRPGYAAFGTPALPKTS